MSKIRYDNVDTQSKAYNLLKKSREGVSFGVVHRGVVIDNQDPSNTGRVKVYIPSLYVGMVEEDIPWALPCFASASYNSGSFIIPEVNSNVWVLFESDDIFRPVYIGGMYTTSSDIAVKLGNGTIAPARTNYVPKEGINPNQYIVTKTPKGSSLWMNDDNGSVTLKAANGSELKLNSENITLSFKDGSSLVSYGDRIVLKTKNNVSITLSDSEPAVNISNGSGTHIIMGSDNKVLIQAGGSKQISIDEEADSVKIHYNESVKVDMSSDSIRMQNKTSVMEILPGAINIKASDVINIDAPLVNFPR